MDHETHYQKYGKKYYEKNKDKIKDRQADYYYNKGGSEVKQDYYNRVKWSKLLISRYGITADDYENILSSQGGVCAICSGIQAKDKKKMDVDHCHNTGNVRGLLCNNCNRALGHFKDSVDNLRKAIDYISGHGGSCGV